jgi:hypothetical protein
VNIVPHADTEDGQTVPDLFLQKPVSIKSLAAAIRHTLDGTQHQLLADGSVS